MRRAQDRARSVRFRKNGARSATIESRALGALKLASEARNENVPAKRADFCFFSISRTSQPRSIVPEDAWRYASQWRTHDLSNLQLHEDDSRNNFAARRTINPTLGYNG